MSDIDPASDLRPYHENFELYRRRYGKLAELLGRYGLKLAIGFLAPLALRGDRVYSFIQTTDAFLLLFKLISSPNVGVALDLWHWHLGGGSLDQIPRSPLPRSPPWPWPMPIPIPRRPTPIGPSAACPAPPA